MKKRFDLRRNEYKSHPEARANKYTIRGMRMAVILLGLVWILNILNIFMVDQKTVNLAMLSVLITYALGVVVFGFLDLRQIWIKYLIIFWVFLIVTEVTTFLTFHAYLIGVFPIIFCSMYSSKKVMWWAYFLTVMNNVVTVVVGYNYGLCDANMVLLTGEPLAEYLGENGVFLLTHVNDRTWWTLPLFFILPRSLIYLSFALICSKISHIIRSNIRYANELQTLSEIDEMTGVYNRNKYLSMIADDYAKEDKVAVIFWDINYLKTVNDTMGHEHGDALIKIVASAIQKISNQFDNAYRIGGDEFVMIMRGGDEKAVKKKLAEWKAEMSKTDGIENVPISASYGYAYGKGTELENIIHDADQMMYENKRKFHKHE